MITEEKPTIMRTIVYKLRNLWVDLPVALLVALVITMAIAPLLEKLLTHR